MNKVIKNESARTTHIVAGPVKKPFFQAKLVVGPVDDPLEHEADAVAEKVLRMNVTPEVQRSPLPVSLMRKCDHCEKEEEELIQRQEHDDTSGTPSTEAESPRPAPRPATGPDYLAMRRPFFDRRVSHLWDSDSALRVWNYNFEFFRRFGLPSSLATTAANFTAPRAIDSQLRLSNPTWWEITDRELNTSTIMGSLPVLEFSPNFRPLAPSWLRGILGGNAGPAIQRKCAKCEEERLQRQTRGAEQTPAVTPSVMNTLSSSGAPLDLASRSFMENRFGYDFSKVKIHTDTLAAQSAQSVNARAYTNGNHIVFNNSQYEPGTDAGKKLLAHELTHVIQQGGTSRHLLQRDENSEYADTVVSQRHEPGTDTFIGTVDRNQFVAAEGSTPRQDLGTLRGVRINFDAANCRVVLPMKIKFEDPSATNWPYCSEDAARPAPAALPRGQFNTLKERVVRLGRSWFTNLYRVNLPESCSRCGGHTVDVSANIEEVTSGETTIGVLANLPGRSCASPRRFTLHRTTANGAVISDDRIVHELGHAIIGYLDEYPVSEGNSAPASVHTSDFSMAGSHSSFGNWMLLQRRHFTFVTTFLDAVLGCTTSGSPTQRGERISTLSGTIGGSDFLGGSLVLQLGYDLSVPIDRMRRLQLFLGAHAHYFQPLRAADRRSFLGGLRAGLQLNTNPSTHGASFSLYGEGGVGRFGLPDSTVPGASTHQWSPYLTGGAMLGYRTPPFGGGGMLGLSLDAGVGSTLRDQSSPGAVPNTQWYYIGLNVAYQFQ